MTAPSTGFSVCAALAVALTFLPLSEHPQAKAADLFRADGYAPLISDRRAAHVGDSLTVLIKQNSTGTNSATTSTAKTTNLGGQITAGGSFSQSMQLGLNNGFDGGGQTGRAGSLMAQISVVVDEVLTNGDLRVSGEQVLTINGERTRIRLKGRVRPADIQNNNSVVSTNLADAIIEYDGKGFVAGSAKPGIIARIFNFLGLT